MSSPIRIALLGSGIFAKSAHIPAIKACKDIELAAIFSRTLESAKSLASYVKEEQVKPDLYSSDSPQEGQIEALFSRDDIDGVIIALPINVQPEYIKMALRHNKAVLSEKPVAKDVETANSLIDFYQDLTKTNPKLLWTVGENFVFEKAFNLAQEWIATKLGKVRHFSISQFAYIDPKENQYYNTQWRKIPGYQGGFLLDGGVHQTALLRAIFPNNAPKKITSLTALHQDYLPPTDTAHSLIQLSDGTVGNMTLMFGSKQTPITSIPSLLVMGEDDVLEISKVPGEGRPSYEVKLKSGPSQVIAPMGVEGEVAAFASALLDKNGPAFQNIKKLGDPKQALQDLSIIENMLKSNGNITSC